MMTMSQAKLARMLSLSMAIFASVFFPSAAGATMTEVFGGPGGGHFSLACDPGHYLVGFHARTGGLVDGIGLICAPYNAGTGKVGSGSQKGYAGGRGGLEQEVYCSPGDAVTGVALVHTRGNGLKRQYVNTVAVSCQRDSPQKRCISSGEGCGAILERKSGGLVGSDLRPYDILNCPPHELATGLQGRSGSYVDAIGLICAALPAPPPAGASSSLGRAPQEVEMNVDRPGNDYRSLYLPRALHVLCKAACTNDTKCEAYTYVKPGVQGRQARCYLKDKIPAAHVSDCCVSGVRPIKALGKRKPGGPDPNIDYGGTPTPPKATLIR
jgi:hypothetical protein